MKNKSYLYLVSKSGKLYWYSLGDDFTFHLQSVSNLVLSFVCHKNVNMYYFQLQLVSHDDYTPFYFQYTYVLLRNLRETEDSGPLIRTID